MERSKIWEIGGFLAGVPREPLLRYRLSDGRWFRAAEEQARDRVAVIERNLAQLAGVDVGERVTVVTAAGSAQLRIVGIAKNHRRKEQRCTSR
jgi:glutathione S-transferase